ncbi:unnamed protein product, partial [Candidula unifasciata]
FHTFSFFFSPLSIYNYHDRPASILSHITFSPNPRTYINHQPKYTIYSLPHFSPDV